jgi:hypothetical protein
MCCLVEHRSKTNQRQAKNGFLAALFVMMRKEI